MTRRIILFFFFVSMVSVQMSWGGWLEDVVGSAAKQAAEKVISRGADESSDAAYNKAKEGVKDEEVDNTDSGSSVSKLKSTLFGSSETDEQAYSKYDFVPGDKVIFFDDFSDTDVGEFPRKWHLKGPQYENNTVEVVEYQGKRFLRSVPGNQGQQNATQYLRLNQKGDLPEKFTIEFDAILAPLEAEGVNNTYYMVLMYDKDDKQLHLIGGDMSPGVLELSGKQNRSMNTQTEAGKSDGKLHHVAVSVNGTFVKAYIDNVRVINDPDGAKRPITQVGLSMGMTGESRSEKIMFTNFRLAEGGKDIKSALATDGKIVTHGILFDTGKDVIKPESLPTLKMILGVLNDDPGLKFSIEGHTDNQGSKSINQPLSEKRASAVKAWLIDKGIDVGRLTTKGLGDTKPLSSNDTAEGRANNRRVEFVRM